MKRIFSILFISSVVISACKNHAARAKTEETPSDSMAMAADKKKKAAEANEKLLEELQKMTPLPEEQLKALMPETLMGGNLSGYSSNSTLGATLTSGEYRVNDSTNIILSIYDCAGPGGAGLYNLQFAERLEYNNENTIEHTKVIDFKGGKAIEFCRKEKAECSLTWFSGGRFLVSLEGKNIGAGELKHLAGNLKIK